MNITQNIISLLKDSIQIIFVIIAGTLGILTYRQARRTILQPIRTEVFKAQLSAITEIMGMFLGKMELELRNSFDFDEFININTQSLYDEFATIFFDVHFEPGTRPYDRLPFKQSLQDSPEPTEIYIQEDSSETDELTPDPRLRAARWARYKHVRLFINKEFWVMNARLGAILENPLLPSGLLDLIAKYRSIANDNQTILWNLLVSVAQEMPDKYPTLELLEKASFSWIRSRYVHEFKHLKPISEEIIQYIRNHFNAEALMRQ